MSASKRPLRWLIRLSPLATQSQVQHNHQDLGHALETALLRRAALSVRKGRDGISQGQQMRAGVQQTPVGTPPDPG